MLTVILLTIGLIVSIIINIFLYKALIVQLGNINLSKKVIDDYLDSSATMGKQVSAQLPDGTSVVGRATGISGNGELLLDTGAVISVGDILHLSLN